MNVGAKYKYESIYFSACCNERKVYFSAEIATAKQRMGRPHVFRVTHVSTLLIHTMMSEID